MGETEEVTVSDDAKGAAKAEPAERTYSQDRLVAEARDRLGVAPHVAAGAFAWGARTKSLTVADAKRLVRDWLAKEVA